MSLEKFLIQNKNKICSMILKYLHSQNQDNQNYEVVWKQYQTQVCECFINFLKTNGFTNIVLTIKKSTYPEFTVIHEGDLYAFDVKVSIDTENPMYDIARLDTFVDRINKYKQEYEIIVKYNVNSGVNNVYFEDIYSVVGINKNQNGVVKFRPYDGKIRPKTWKDFDTQKKYFNNKKELIEGIRKAQILRNKDLFEKWKKEFNSDELKEIIN
jgi:hypothetical protein